VISAAEALEQRDPAFCRLVRDPQSRLLWRGRKGGSNRHLDPILERWRLHAWVLMTNHCHLLVETPEANLARGMRRD